MSIKISDCLRDIVEKNSLLQFGLSKGLLNLTQIAKYLKPLIESRTKKSVKASAILMNLSRFQRISKKTTPEIDNFKAENITIVSNLCSMTFFKNQKIHEHINKLYTDIQKISGYMTVTEGTNEITIIIDISSVDLVKENLNSEPKSQSPNISGVSIKFDEKYSDIPGLLYYLIQQITLQNINIIEISSTFTELIIYVEKKDTKLAFDTIYNRFL